MQFEKQVEESTNVDRVRVEDSKRSAVIQHGGSEYAHLGLRPRWSEARLEAKV